MATKSAPFSLRLSRQLDALVTEEARRTRRSKGAVIEALADEAMRSRRFPGIGFRGADWDRRAWVVGAGLDVWEIMEMLGDFGSVEAMAAVGDVREANIRLAVAYHREYPDEIERMMAENRPTLDELRAMLPTARIIEVSE
jgi:hypothetical protein